MLNPYNIIPSENGYTFFTDYNLSYYVYINQGSKFFVENENLNGITFSFGFQPIQDHTANSHDSRIEQTLISIFSKFFTENKGGILSYICDASDGQELVRLRLFNKWYEKHMSETHIKLHVQVKLDNDSNFCGAIIFLKNNPYSSFIHEAFFKEFYE